VSTASIPAFVRDGYLAPFAELAWLTTPTAHETQWLIERTTRFAELTTSLLDPQCASIPFLQWLDARYLAPPNGAPLTSWSRLESAEPDTADAILRLHHVGLVALPAGARLAERHLHPPRDTDWVVLLDMYDEEVLRGSTDDRNITLRRALTEALPGVGYQLTRAGIRRGPATIDRIIGRSDAKMTAAAEILSAEHQALGEELRAVVLTEYVSTDTTPAALTKSADTDAVSARSTLERVLDDPALVLLHPVVVTGRCVLAGADTARALVAWIAEQAPDLALDPIDDTHPVVEIGGAWTSRTWVPLLTRYFQEGHSTVLIGTRALLGEGWDARSTNVLVDLTSSTTPTAVVQTRGRALRTDPQRPMKVANNWTVVCVTDAHPAGASDWNRFVRKHAGFFAVDADGAVVDGVSHVDEAFSPYAPPAPSEFERINAVMLQRAADRDTTRALWHLGEPYEDTLIHTIRITRAGAHVGSTTDSLERPAPPRFIPDAIGGELRDRSVIRAKGSIAVTSAAELLTIGTSVALQWPLAGAVAGLLAVAVAGGVGSSAIRSSRAAAVLDAGDDGADVSSLAYAVADALHAAGLSTVDSSGVTLQLDATGALRVALAHVSEAESATFVTAFDEVLAPLASPRYVIARYLLARVPAAGWQRLRAGRAWLRHRRPPTAVVYHAVPSVLAVNKTRSAAFAAAWSVWVSVADVVRTNTPEGEGILVTQRGNDPMQASTALRVVWQ